MIAIAQHFGLPTRVLDWSCSPYLATFFAVSGAIKGGASISRAVYFLNRKELTDKLDKAEFEFLEYVGGIEKRIINQKGIFTNVKMDEDDLGIFLAARQLDYALKELIIPPRCFTGLAQQLKAMDITYERLFPGLEGIANEIIYQMLLSC